MSQLLMFSCERAEYIAGIAHAPRDGAGDRVGEGSGRKREAIEVLLKFAGFMPRCSPAQAYNPG